MNTSLRTAILLSWTLGVTSAHVMAQDVPGSAPRLAIVGAYRFGDGTIAIVTGDSKRDVWRYRNLRTGRSHRMYPDGTLTFHSGDDWESEAPFAHRYTFAEGGTGPPVTLTLVSGRGSQPRIAHRIALPETWDSIRSGDVSLAAKLVLPEGPGPFPAVVIAQGSELASATEGSFFPYLFATAGIATLVYDKRGTGHSGGTTPLSFRALAADLMAATEWLAGRPRIDSARIGATGFSQGGWVAPLAALQSRRIRYLLIGYGLAMSVADEDRIESPGKLRALGFDEQAVTEYNDLNAEIHAAVRDGFRAGWDGIAAKVAVYKDRPWFAALGRMGTWAGALVSMGLEQAKQVAPAMMRELDPFYDPVPTLEALDIPVLWLLAERDLEAPPEVTITVLERLKASGRPIDYVVFPRTDHGIVEFEMVEGRRVPRRYAPGYLSAMTAWLRAQGGLP